LEDRNAMLYDLLDLLMRPEAYAYVWRDGELYVEPLTDTLAESSAQTRKDADVPIAA
jgi:hypothetical protein